LAAHIVRSNDPSQHFLADQLMPDACADASRELAISKGGIAMNRIYRLVWCQSLGAVVVASELTSIKRGSPGGSSRNSTSRPSLLLAAAVLGAFGIVHAGGVHAQDAKLADMQELAAKYGNPHPIAQATANVAVDSHSLSLDSAVQLSVPVLPARSASTATSASLKVGRQVAAPGTPAGQMANIQAHVSAETAVADVQLHAGAEVATIPVGAQPASHAVQSAVTPLLQSATQIAGASVPDSLQPAGSPQETTADRRLVYGAKSAASDSTHGTDIVGGEDSDETTVADTVESSPATAPSTMFSSSLVAATAQPLSASASLASPLALATNAVPVVPAPAPVATGLIVGNGGVVGAVTQLLGPTTDSLFNNSDGYVSSGSLRVSNANFTQGYSTVSALGLPLLNLTPVGSLLTSTDGTVVGGTGINSHLTLIGGVTSGNYIDNINNGAAGGVLGLVLPNQAPAWASTCLNVLGVVKESCWALNAAQDYQVLVGDGASANGSKEVVIGTNANHTLASVDASTAFPGAGANDPNNPSGLPTADYEARLGHSVVIGDSASGTANAQTIVGAEATASVANSVALGYQSAAARGALSNYTAYGLNAPQNSAGEVSIGAPGQERQITNLAAGRDATDAVNVAQLQGVAAVAANSVQYDDASNGAVTLAGPASTDGGVTGGTRIGNLQQGALSATSTDAVNGAQLYATNQSITNIYDTGTRYFHANGSGADSNAAAADSVAIGSAAIGTAVGSVALGAGSVADRAGMAGAAELFSHTAVASTAGALSVGAAGAERQIINVAGGTQDTDAVNVRQLNAVNNQVQNVSTLAVKYDADSNGNPTNRITLTGDGSGAPVGIANVAAGSVAAGSSDAVNGSQLAATNTAVANYFGGTANFDPTTGAWTAPTFTLTSIATDGSSTKSSYGNVTDAFSAVDGSIVNVNNRIDSINNAGIKYFHVNSTLADADASGIDSTAVGPAAVASGDSSLALGNTASASASNAIAIGTGARAGMTNSVALGAGSSTQVGALSNYTAYGLAAPQNSSGEVNVGNRQITGVAAGSAASDAVNVAQLDAVNKQVQVVDTLAVKYDADASGNPSNRITLTGDGTGAPVGIANVAAGAETSTSTDAANGSQLWHWTQDTTNSYSNTSLYNDINNLQKSTGTGKVKYFNINSTLSDSSASGSNSIAIGPAAQAAGTDSVAMGNGATASADNSVAIGAGSVADRANTVSVGSDGGERQITHVAAGSASTDAVNVGQLNSTVTASTKGTVRYDVNTDGSVDYNDVTLGSGDGNTTIHNVAAGAADTDAVNMQQFKDGMQQTANWAKSYTDQQVQQLGNRANAGVAAAMAMAGLPQAYEPGKSMGSVAGSTFRGESSLAIGVSMISEGGRWVYKLTGSTDSRGDAGVTVGAGMQW
jgi:autotransporter adhesin